MKIIKLYTGNIIYGRLPPGCRYCLLGLKTVIFITGACPRSCYYCPISFERRGRDVFYVNERPVRTLNDVIAEVATSGSRGASLTGGDPLSRLERTLAVLGTLKSVFEESFHVHLYTSGKTLKSADTLARLENAGLDELRLHPELDSVGKLIDFIKRARPAFKIGFEVPAFPDGFDTLMKLIEKVLACDAIEFVNINELEISESNFEELKGRGYSVSDDGRSVRGSRETALKLIETASDQGYPLSLHFCPARSKDAYQTRLRLYRRGVMSAKPHEIVSDDGTILKALVPEDCESVPQTLLFRSRYGLETSLLVAELAGARHSLIEELPDYNRTLLNIV